ncbi:MAG TPA: glycosyl transferase, partial [Lachnospiraceae bacterium]|nr:glycosyl transferase [Lachnospiraceae bacterium]
KESLDKKKELWDYLKTTKPMMYNKIRHSVLGYSMHLPGHTGHAIIKIGYRISQKIIGFG